MKAWLSDQGIQYDVQSLLQHPPSKEELSWMASQFSGGAREMLSPIKIEANDPHYVEHIKGQENRLSDEEYIDIFHQFPDLLKKPILTNREKLVMGYDEDQLRTAVAE